MAKLWVIWVGMVMVSFVVSFVVSRFFSKRSLEENSDVEYFRQKLLL